MIAGIILAAGKGTRINLRGMNKTALEFNGKPLIEYGVELFQTVCQEIVIVVGFYKESVKQAVKKTSKVCFVEQRSQRGTGDAVKVAVKYLMSRGEIPDQVFVGYGDHMMFYPSKVLKQMLDIQRSLKSTVTLISCDSPNPQGMGRIIRDTQGVFIKFVEEKDAGKKEKAVNEVNAGLYCFEYNFLTDNIDNLQKSPISGEYYINDFIDLAKKAGLGVEVIKVPFVYVGVGINTKGQLEESARLHKRSH